MSRILIAEDEPRIASFLSKGLKANGFVTAVARDGDEALAMAHSADFDLLVLDLGLPGKDGFWVLRELRERDKHTPVIILTARHELSDKVAGLEEGADDYITKPFRFEEFLARVRARLRDDRSRERTLLKAGNTKLDLRTRRADIGGRTVELTAREFALAELFFRHVGQVLSREQILSHVWGYDYDPGSNVVDVYVGYLRQKFGKHRIASVRGMGYRLEDSDTPSDVVAGDGRPARILIVEDESRIAELIAQALSGDGSEVVIAEDGEVGLYLATSETFDAMVLDLGLPGKSGMEVLGAIHRERPELPVIVLTGRDDPQVRETCISAGAADFQAKPLVLDALRMKVHTQLLRTNKAPTLET